MNYSFFLILKSVFLIKRKINDLQNIIEKHRKILKIHEIYDKKLFDSKKKSNSFFKDEKICENEETMLLFYKTNSLVDFSELDNNEELDRFDLFSQITTDFYNGCTNKTNNAETIEQIEKFRIMCMYDLTMSSDMSSDFNDEILLNTCLNSVNLHQKKNFNFKQNIEPSTNTFNRKNIIDSKFTMTYKNFLNKIKLQISHHNWIQNKFIHVKYYDENYLFNFFRGFEFINHLLHAFLIMNQFDINLKTYFFNKKIDDGNLYQEIFVNLNLKIDFEEHKPICLLTNKEFFFGNFIKDGKYDIKAKNFIEDIIQKLKKTITKIQHQNTDFRKKKYFVTPKRSFYNITEYRFSYYFFNLNPLDILKFSINAKNLVNYCLLHNIDVLAKESFKYIVEQIMQIEDLCDKILFFTVFFVNIYNNYLIRTSIVKLVILIHFYKCNVKIYKNSTCYQLRDLQAFQVKMWYLLLFCIKPTIDLETYGIPKILSLKFRSFIYNNFNNNKIEDVLNYYVYAIFLFQTNKSELEENLAKSKDKKDLPVDKLREKKSEIFLHFVLKILFDNNLLD